MMRKKIKRRLRKKLFSSINVLIAVCSVLTSYSVVTFSNSFRDLPVRESELDNLASSAHRIAIAFEQYNQKRFIQ